MQTLVQYVDTAMVGVLGAQASAAVGLTGSVTWLVNGVFFAAGIGALAVISRALGARDGRTARETAGAVRAHRPCGRRGDVRRDAAGVARAPGWLNAEEEIKATPRPISASSACRCSSRRLHHLRLRAARGGGYAHADAGQRRHERLQCHHELLSHLPDAGDAPARLDLHHARRGSWCERRGHRHGASPMCWAAYSSPW